MTNHLWYGTSGPRDASIVLVGESWGSEELKQRQPFVGPSGHELDRILLRSGVSRREILCTNLIPEQPPQNEIFRFFEPKSNYTGDRINGLAPSSRIVAAVGNLYQQINASPRRLIIAVGNWSLWALSQCTGAEVIREANNRAIPPELQTWAPNGIMNWRGSMLYTAGHAALGHLDRCPLLPIIHPAAIMRQWSNRDVTIHDLKTRVPLALRGDWRPNPAPTVLAPPSFADATNRLKLWLAAASRGKVRLAIDIETSKTLITCLGIADSTNFALSIPFIRVVDRGYISWWQPDQEARLLHLLRLLFHHPNILIEGQNFIYDTQYIQHYMGVTPQLSFDTMLAQNVMFPGTPKDLGYLSSLYCKYHWYWKEDHKEWDTKGTVEQLLQYNALDCLRTWEIAENQRALLKHLGMEAQMDLKMRTNDLCLRMMNRGVLINKARRHELAADLREALTGLQSELLEIVPQDFVKERSKTESFWYTSSHQTKTLFNDILGFKTINNRKTGRPTSGKEALKQYQQWYPEFRPILNRLRLMEQVDNALSVLQAPMDHDSRMRCSYNPGGTETHRLSSSKNAFGRGLNLQNLTKGEEDE